MGTKADEFDEAMRHILTRNTPTVLASFTAEVDYAIQHTIGRCEGDWTPVRVRAAMSRVASIMSGRAFVGLPLSRDPQWIEATVNYTQDVSRAWMVLKMIPWPLRAMVASFLKEVKNRQCPLPCLLYIHHLEISQLTFRMKSKARDASTSKSSHLGLQKRPKAQPRRRPPKRTSLEAT